MLKVRNQLAHRWNGKEVFYGTDADGGAITITENIDKFKPDAERVWIEFIEVFMKEEEKGVGRLISKLDDPNTIRE